MEIDALKCAIAEGERNGEKAKDFIDRYSLWDQCFDWTFCALFSNKIQSLSCSVRNANKYTSSCAIMCDNMLVFVMNSVQLISMRVERKFAIEKNANSNQLQCLLFELDSWSLSWSCILFNFQLNWQSERWQLAVGIHLAFMHTSSHSVSHFYFVWKEFHFRRSAVKLRFICFTYWE